MKRLETGIAVLRGSVRFRRRSIRVSSAWLRGGGRQLASDRQPVPFVPVQMTPDRRTLIVEIEPSGKGAELRRSASRHGAPQESATAMGDVPQVPAIDLACDAWDGCGMA
ncbi:MAG: hypothetical protein U1D30_07130 [Planctomycetota bacterium]